MNNKSELHLLIDWTCFFQNLEKKFIDPLNIMAKIEVKNV